VTPQQARIHYEQKAKPARADAIHTAALLGSPEGACFIPGTSYVYCFNGQNLFVTRWTASGRTIRKSFAIPISSTIDTIEYQGVLYIMDTRTKEVFRDAADRLPEHLLPGHIERANRWAHCVNVDMKKINKPLTDNSERSRQSYHRRQAKALFEHIPVDYTLLPGDSSLAYKVVGTTVHVIKPRAPQTVAAGASRFKETTHPIYATALIYGKKYKLAPDGKRLYREGHTEDVFGLGDDTNEQRLVFDELRPHDKPVLPGHLVWYEIKMGPQPRIMFTRYKGRNAKRISAPIVESKVLFDGDTWAVDAFGTLRLAKSVS
jgi:hypothetical protein